MPPVNRQPPMRHVDDGILKGRVHGVRKPCGVCGQTRMVIRIEEITLPQGIEPSKSIIAYRDDPTNPKVVPLTYIGIGCGCYAKFHRQVAHIKTQQARKLR